MSDEILERIDAKLARIALALENLVRLHFEPEERKDYVAEKIRTAKENRIDSMSLYDTNLLTKTRNALLRHGFKTVGQISSLSARQILGLRGIGQQGLNDIKNMLAEYGKELPKADFGGVRA